MKITKLEKLHKEILKETRRIKMLKNTPNLDVDFMRDSIKESKTKITKYQKEFDIEYELQN